MNNMDSIVFVTHNQGKVASANKYFDGKVQFDTINFEVKEIRGTLDEIAIDKVKQAYELTGKPTLAMDAGFEVDALNGFPGAYVNHMLDTIGIDGILKLMEGVDNRTCKFTQSLAFYCGEGKPLLFHGCHTGVISHEKLGRLSSDDWSDISLIYIPTIELELGGKGRTLAQMNHEQRVKLAAKDNESSAFHAFREWYINNKN